MKRLVLAFVILLSLVSISLAQPLPTAPAEVKPAPVAVKAFMGKVDMVTAADAVKGTKASIAVIDEKAQKVSFDVTAATIITDAENKPVALGVLAKDEMIHVAFISKDTGYEAVAIKTMN